MRTARPFTSRPTAISTTAAGRLSVKTSTERDVDYWGVGSEAREYYSFAPQIKYVDADVTPAITFAGGVNNTHISDDDAFEVRTTLRLNVALRALPPPLTTSR